MRRLVSVPPDLWLESQLAAAGLQRVAGLDEAGRGAWAGPVTAAAVVLPVRRANLRRLLQGVRDSKEMTPAGRERWELRIREVALAVGLGQASPQEVDALGPLRATRLAMERALQMLPSEPDYLLIDHLRLPEIELPQTGLPHGDARVLSIAAASVVAKVARDRAMVDLEAVFPGYGFAQHKGYGTPGHRTALHRLGPCDIHRRSYAPVAARVRDGISQPCLVDPSKGLAA